MTRILHPIMVGFAWIWVGIHNVLTFLGVPAGPGIGWVLSIILLTVLARVLILPLYLKQIRSMRNMQVLQPEIQKIQAKYKGKKDEASRQAMTEETMELYKQYDASPFASCLPMIVQLPIIFALYRVIFAVEEIKEGTYPYPNLGPLTKDVAINIDKTKLFGVGLSQQFSDTTDLAQKAVFIVFILVMVGFQFLTMRLSMQKNMAPQQDTTNPLMKNQKMMMYMMPLMFVFTGFIFKMALLVYMVTTTLFAFLQQLWVIKVIPTPGSPAYEELLEKREGSYKSWAEPLFEKYDAEARSLEPGSEALTELQTATLATCEKDAKKQKVPAKFPEDWTASDKLNVYRNLAKEKWAEVPDDAWMSQLVARREAAKRAEEAKKARKQRPKKMSRAQRMEAAKRERQAQEDEKRRQERAERRREQKARSGKGSLTDEEIERRRQERRAKRREQKRKNN